MHVSCLMFHFQTFKEPCQKLRILPEYHVSFGRKYCSIIPIPDIQVSSSYFTRRVLYIQAFRASNFLSRQMFEFIRTTTCRAKHFLRTAHAVLVCTDHVWGHCTHTLLYDSIYTTNNDIYMHPYVNIFKHVLDHHLTVRTAEEQNMHPARARQVVDRELRGLAKYRCVKDAK
jgi:hypothetical protein